MAKLKKMAKGGSVSDADMARVEAIMGQMGKTISDADRAKLNMMNMDGYSKTISDADRERLLGLLGETGRSVSDADRGRASRAMGKVKGYKNGGCVMKGRGGSFKGIS